MPRVGFEPTIAAGERPKTYALDRAATGTGTELYISAANYRYIREFEYAKGYTVVLSDRDRL